MIGWATYETGEPRVGYVDSGPTVRSYHTALAAEIARLRRFLGQPRPSR
ncbi:MAG TPA: hypothetical protein VIL37_12415 [Natronosporangium sp.]